MRHTVQRIIKELEMPGQRGRGITIERRADLCRDLRDGHVLGKQPAVLVLEMIHVTVQL